MMYIKVWNPNLPCSSFFWNSVVMDYFWRILPKYAIFYKNWKTHTFVHVIVSQKVFEPQISTIPHFKGLDK